MGLLVDGKWHDRWYDTKASGGRFIRSESQFRDVVSAEDGARFRAEPNRYHLYVSLACPWAHRTLVVRKLKGLEGLIDVSVVHWHMGSEGWTFEPGEGATGDRIGGAARLYEIYTRANANYSGRVTVPVLWDKKTETIVSNESSEIIRMLNGAFDQWGRAEVDLYPGHLRSEIDAVNAWIYDQINNGVYKCGFASTQAAYEAAFESLFEGLDRAEALLEGKRFLVGDQLTEADVRLFTTLVRFDPVYFGHFKCNRQQLQSFPNLWRLTRRIYQLEGIADTVNFHHIKTHYYGSHTSINPTGIVPLGPVVDFDQPVS